MKKIKAHEEKLRNTLYEMTHKYAKAEIIEDGLRGWGIGIFGLSIIPVVLTSLISELVMGLVFAGWVVLVITYCCIAGQIYQYYEKKHNECIKVFMDSDEYKKQYKAYCDANEKKRQERLAEQSKNLVEAYDILDDKQMPKEEKIELLKKYIEKGE